MIHQNNNTFAIIHQNVQSLGNCVDTITALLEEHSNCKCLCISEHWRKADQLKATSISNFNLASYFCRKNGYGGVAVYLHKDITFSRKRKIDNLSVEGVFECAWVEFNLKNELFVIAVIYRSPKSDIKLFLKKLELLLVKIIKENINIFIAGDFNIEFLKQNSSRLQILSVMNSFDLYPTISENTRITPTSQSCIDNIFTNVPEKNILSCVIATTVSDHAAQKIVFSCNHVPKKIRYYKRFFSAVSRQDFFNLLTQEKWEEVFEAHQSDVNKQWYVFMQTFLLIFNENFPKKLVTKDQKRKNKPLYYKNEQIQKVKKRLDILLMLKRKNNNFNESYSTVKKEYDQLLIKARSDSYKRRINNSENKNKCMWSILKEITGNNSQVNDTMIAGNPTEIANNYNTFLLTAIPERKIPHVNCKINIQENDRSLFLKPVNAEEILELRKRIKNKHSSGDDEIPTSLIRQIIPAIIDVLCHVINNSLKEGIFPDSLKLAAIRPLYKNKGDKNLLDNYRPISLLSGFSKLFEIVMCTRIMDFMNDCNVFSDNQHGYLGKKSTQTAIFQFTHAILKHLEEGDMALGIFLDLSKAFDCLDRSILLQKLNLYGIRGRAFEWIESYLNNRTQRVTICRNGNIYKSEIAQNSVGVPQGSILAPYLFIIYLNDINYYEMSSNDFNLTQYADDTNLLVGASSIPEIRQNGNIFFVLVNDWFEQNKLQLNKDKTNTILFRTKLNKTKKPESITIGKSNLEVKNSTKFLGIYLDEFLDWSSHVEYLNGKLNKICYCIRIVARYLDEPAKRTLYFANFEGTARYGIIYWAANSGVQDIFIVQKRVIRTIYKMLPLQSCRGVFRSKKILTIFALYIFETIMFVFRNKDTFNALVGHNYNTRTNNINFPVHRLTLSEKHPYYMGIRLFNKLDASTKSITIERIFKRKLKALLINLEPYSIDDYLNG